MFLLAHFILGFVYVFQNSTLTQTINAIVIIPARGGSKRIHGKNIRMLDGKPLLAYVVSAAAGVGLPCLVSTDSPDIAAVAQEYGAEI